MLLGADEDLEEKPALMPSLFPFVAPTLYFSTANEKGQPQRRHPANRVTSAHSRPHWPAAVRVFVLCSGAAAGGAATAAEVEDEHCHAQRGQARRRQVSLQGHQE